MSLELWRDEILGEHGELALGASRFKSVDHEKQANGGIGRTGKIGYGICNRASWIGGAADKLALRGAGALSG